MTLIRWQNVLFALLPGIDALSALVHACAPAGSRGDSRRTVAGSALFLAARRRRVPAADARVAGDLRQLDRAVAGRTADPLDGSASRRHPVVGAQRPVQHRRRSSTSARSASSSSPSPGPALGMPLLAAVAVMIYFNACIQDWWGSAGFGGRRFDGVIPLFALGLAAFIDVAPRIVQRHAVGRRDRRSWPCSSVWNLALMGAAQAGDGPHRRDAVVRSRLGAQARVVHGWFGNPFTYPASLVFALRNGVSPGDYDLLVDEPLSRRSAAAVRPRRHRRRRTTSGLARRDGWHAPSATARSPSGGRRRPRRCASRSITRRRSACRCGSTPSRIRARRRRR